MLHTLGPLLFQLSVSVAPSEVKTLLEATIRVDVVEQRFVSIRVDSLPSGARGAALVNRHARLYSYLVEHQLPPKILYAGVLESSSSPQAVVVRNLNADTVAVRRIAEFLALATGSQTSLAALSSRRVVTEAQALAIAARFFHPVVLPNKEIRFYRCAGINGIEDLGERRDPQIEAFVFWGVAPIVFDEDSSSADAQDVVADFQRAKTAFKTTVTMKAFTVKAVADARDDLYARMAASQALARVIRRAYDRITPRLPFRVLEWELAAR